MTLAGETYALSSFLSAQLLTLTSNTKTIYALQMRLTMRPWNSTVHVLSLYVRMCESNMTLVFIGINNHIAVGTFHLTHLHSITHSLNRSKHHMMRIDEVLLELLISHNILVHLSDE
jgi:hypothetical protein